MNRIWLDLVYGFRALRRGGLLVGVAVLSLGIGIGANTTIFSAVDVFLLRPLPYPDSDRLYIVWTDNRERDWTEVGFSVPDFRDLRERSRSMSVAATDGASFNLAAGDRPERVTGARVTPSFFRVLGVAPAVGRGFTEEEEVEGRDAVAVISHRLWMRRFEGDPDALGGALLLDGEPHTLVGVMPTGFWYGSPGTDVLVPLPTTGDHPRDRREVEVLARLAAGVPEARATEEARRIAGRLADEFPETNAGNGAHLVPLRDQVFNEGFRSGSLLSTVAVLFVLLIACANVATLLLAHAASREREVAVRAALGASRTRIARQFLLEALLLSFAGAAVGLLLSVAGIRGLVSVMPAWFPRVDEIGLDPRVLLFTGAVTVASALLVGLFPALRAARPDLVKSLKAGGRGGTAPGAGRLRKGLVAGELSLALALVVCSALLVQAFVEIRLADPGFDESDVLSFRVGLPASDYPDAEVRADFHAELDRRLAALPGVRSVGAASLLPTQGSSSAWYALPGEDISSDRDRKVTDFRNVTPGFFDAMDIPVLRGRAIRPSDRPDRAPVVLVNETLAERHWPGEDPIGRELTFTSGTRRVVGVVADTRYVHASLGDRPTVYFSALQRGDPNLAWVLEADVRLESLAPAARTEVASLDPTLPAYDLRTLRSIIDESLGGDTIMAKIMSVVALIALVLALAGVYGMMAYSVSRRTREMGIRIALGARDRDVVGMLLRQGGALAAAGVAAGLVVAFGMARGLSFFLYGVGAFEPVTYASVALALLAAGLAATWLPARRATKVDPLVALRAE